MKIVYCTDSLVSSGGTERVLTTKLNWLSNHKDVEVHLVSLREDGQPFFKLDSGVKLILLDIKQGDKKEYKNALAKVLVQIEPDITVAVSGMSVEVLHSIPAAGKTLLEFHYTKNFLVNFINGIESIKFRWLHLLKMRYLQWKLSKTARKYDLFVGLTAKDVGLWGNPKNMTYVHNPLSFRSKQKSDCKSHKIISVGSWTPAKGMDQLLEAFGPVSKEFPDWTVELYGSGQDEKRLREIISRYGMQKQVSLNAPVKDISEKLREASIYAFPSRSDGFGLVITEAMECGLPTVAMDCPCGPCEILTPETGIVVPEKNISAFREGLRKLMINPGLRAEMGKYASIEVSRFYTDVIMHRWLQLFNELNSNDLR